MHVLVAHGSKRGGTAGIAAIIAEGLRAAGHTADLAPAHQVRDLSRYDAVIVGGGLYAQRWHADARRFVERNVAALRTRPVWLFSSGPLDDSASSEHLPPSKQVARLWDRIRARGHVTFGGYLAADAHGFIASALAKQHSGDWRDPARIRAWSAEVASYLAALPAPTPPPAIAPVSDAWAFWPAERAVRRLLVALCLLTGISASGGGWALAWRPDGSLLRAPLALLEHSPFASFLVPGLLLALVGLANLVAAIALVTSKAPRAEALSFFAGASLTGFVVVEMIMLRTINWLQLIFFVVGCITLVDSLKLRRRRVKPADAPNTPADSAHLSSPSAGGPLTPART